MSPVSSMLARRRVPRGASVLSSERCTVATLRPGEGGVVDSLSEPLPEAEARRLLDLGFVPDAAIRVVRRPPWRDPVIVSVAGCDLALRQAQAQHIRVNRRP